MNTSRDLVGRPMEILLVEDNLADAGLTMAALKDGGQGEGASDAA